MEKSVPEKSGKKPATGVAAAALASPAIGLFLMSLASVAAAASEGANRLLSGLTPLAQAPGDAHVGKAAVLFLGWGISWALLHLLLRRREVDVGGWLIASLGLIGIATTLLWPPMVRVILG